MSMKSLKQIKEKFNSLLTERDEEEGIEHDAVLLMAGFLSEIERIQTQRSINRKTLAGLIKTSASYLTQVFRGDKPLNFDTIAKIQRKLDLRFEIRAYPKYGFVEENKVETPIIQVNLSVNFLVNYDNDNVSSFGEKFTSHSIIDSGMIQIIDQNPTVLN